MKYRKKPVLVEANQFFHGATAPIGVRTREDGSCYVITIHEQEADVAPRDWIILEDPPGDGTRAYPCKPDVFAATYEPADGMGQAAKQAEADRRLGAMVRERIGKALADLDSMAPYSNKCPLVVASLAGLLSSGITIGDLRAIAAIMPAATAAKE